MHNLDFYIRCAVHVYLCVMYSKNGDHIGKRTVFIKNDSNLVMNFKLKHKFYIGNDVLSSETKIQKKTAYLMISTTMDIETQKKIKRKKIWIEELERKKNR